VVHYFEKPSVAVVELIGKVKAGDKIFVKGQVSDFSQEIESMEIEHEAVESAGKRDAVGLKVVEKVRVGDRVFLDGS
tara:strand:- start:186 stop:416 length:231 start_codon:yes stop_codon:yes gene_type:complete